MSGSAPAATQKAATATITRTSGVALQRQCACGQHTIGGGECDECAEQRMSLQRRAASLAGTPAVPPAVYDVLRMPGQPLDSDTRAFMERRLSHDFSRVRVHNDAPAADSARGVNAMAYTVGRDVVFGAGQYAPRSNEGRKLLAHELTHVVQQGHADWAALPARLEVAPADHPLELESQRSAETVDTGAGNRAASGSTAPVVQRAPVQEGSAPESAPAATAAPARGPLIIDDDAADAAPGQMRKTEFLDGLRTHVCEVADRALASAGRTAQGCPLIEHWIDRMRTRRGSEIEQSIRRYAPESAAAATARDYYATVGERVRQGAERWARTGDLRGIPPELLNEMGGGGIAGILGSIGGFFSGVGKLFAKAREGGVRAADPAAARAQLRAGTPLESGVRARMERVFGRGFGSVRVHTDSSSASAASALNARAFTVGDDLAFGTGEYQPGTPVGDALLAHELAHVAQQSHVESAAGEPANASLEEDADRSAFEAVASLWHGSGRKRPRNAMPRLRSALSLQRCASGPKLQNPQAVEREYQEARNEVLGALATTELLSEVRLTFENLHGVYDNALEDAGTDEGKQAQAQQEFLTQVRNVRGSYRRQLEMTRRYHVAFTAYPTQTEFQRQPPRARYTFHTWSDGDLQKVDAILRRVPPGSLANVQKIQRESGTNSDVPASWQSTSHTLTVYDGFFSDDRNDDQRAQYLVHEIGHSTEVDRTVGSFQHLPSPEWMALSDWKTSTAQTFGPDIGVSGQDLIDGKAAVDASRRMVLGFPRAVRVANRMVVIDRYASVTTGDQYLHYDVAHNAEFVTDYARSHPADDLAESYAQYVLNPAETRRKLDIGPPGTPNKWNYLTRRLAQNAAAAQAAATQQPAGQAAAGQPATPPVQPKLRSAGPTDIYEQEADRAAEQVVRAGHRAASRPVFAEAPVMVQRLAAEGESNAPAAAPGAVPGELQAGGQSRELIVEDDAARLEPGQMRKSAFLEGLQGQACAAAEPVLAARGVTARGCPVIERWIGRMRSRSSAEVEGSIRRYAPEAAGASSAREYYAVVGQRVRQGVARWAATGDTSAVPPELVREMAGGGIAGMFAAAGAGIRSVVSGVARLFGKARGGELRDADPAAIAGRLDSGASLDTSMRGKMEGALGHSFGAVRVHTGADAAGMAADLNARAFTIGSDIVFGAGEYRPGTDVGDALMAHELAHVVQQRNATPMLPGTAQGGESQSLEADANRAAAGALGGERSVPQRRSSLRLQRCHGSNAAALPSLAALRAMSSYELSQITPETFAQAPSGDPAVARQYADYARASRVVKAIYAQFGVTFDIERGSRVLGREPTPGELSVLNGLMGSIRSVRNVGAAMTAPQARRMPTAQGSSAPSLQGHARVLRNQTEFLIKYFQLQWLVAGSLGPTNPQLDAWLKDGEWSRLGITPGENYTITAQERRVMAFEAGVAMININPGFFFPPDDMFYLAPQAGDLSSPDVQALARHEIVHLLGGRERTRLAFVRKFGEATYKKYWEPFEEGVAELINMEAAPSQAGAGAPGVPQTSSGYGHYVSMMYELMTQPGMSRDTVFQAYFTGTISEQIFDFLTARVHE